MSKSWSIDLKFGAFLHYKCTYLDWKKRTFGTVRMQISFQKSQEVFWLKILNFAHIWKVCKEDAAASQKSVN